MGFMFAHILYLANFDLAPKQSWLNFAQLIDPNDLFLDSNYIILTLKFCEEWIYSEELAKI